MRQLLDLAGQPFGRLTAIYHTKKNGKGSYWVCDCACGTQNHIVKTGNLRSGEVLSCGCLQRESVKQQFRTHGKTGTPEYNIWSSMRQRCSDPHSQRYKDYGERGIAVCQEWQESFEKFYEDMGPRPSQEMSLERRNNNLGYNKENCYWATRKQQGRNTRRNHYITLHGETKCLVEWLTIFNIQAITFHSRRKRGLSDEEALKRPITPRNQRNHKLIP